MIGGTAGSVLGAIGYAVIGGVSIATGGGAIGVGLFGYMAVGGIIGLIASRGA